MITALCDATIFTSEAMVEGHALLIKDGKILDIVANRKAPADTNKKSYPEHILAPGFIDAQVNGGANILFNNTPTGEACVAIAKAHQTFGTTRLLPTFITDRPEITAQAIAAMRTARKTCKNILGIHIEGPHLGLERRGVHKADYIRGITQSDLQLYHHPADEVMLMTVAPECVPPDQIKILRQQDIIISLGHTSATPDQIRGALKAGATGFTHLFNGMGKPGGETVTPADTALGDPGSWCGIIIDGFHVSPELVSRALTAKPPGKLFLVSDAMPPAASDKPQTFKLYDETVRVEKGRCVNNEGKLAGSSITISDAVQNCVKLGIAIEEVLRMASSYPAAFLGLDNRLGKLLPGYEADVVVLNHSFVPQAAFVAGA